MTTLNLVWPPAETFAHELGHNLGCAHDRENAGGLGGTYPYSFGGRFTSNGQTYRTVMAYPPGLQSLLLSSPDLYYEGARAGVRIAAQKEACNATTVSNNLWALSNFR